MYISKDFYNKENKILSLCCKLEDNCKIIQDILYVNYYELNKGYIEEIQLFFGDYLLYEKRTVYK